MLANFEDGEGAVEASGETSFTWSDTCYYDYLTTINSGGTIYNEWVVTLPGPNHGQELELTILQVDNTNTGRGTPEDGTYALGGSMGQNDLRVSVGSDNYYFVLPSVGSFTLTKNGDRWNIELNAEDIESGGIGEDDKIIDVNAALKAQPE